MCFVVFCGVSWCFAGVLWCFSGVFCGVLRVFCSISTKHTKHPKNIEKTEKHKNSQYARVFVLRAFSKSKKIRLYCTKHLSQNICKTSAKHRKTPQNSHKTRFVKLRRKTPQKNAKRSKSHKTVVIQPQYVLRAFGVYFKNTLDLSQKYTMRNTRKLRGVSRTPAGGHGF